MAPRKHSAEWLRFRAACRGSHTGETVLLVLRTERLRDWHAGHILLHEHKANLANDLNLQSTRRLVSSPWALGTMQAHGHTSSHQ
jgi:hypothetical protein